MHMGFYLGVMKIFEDKIEVVVAPPFRMCYLTLSCSI